jgi:hypothetical protein
MRTLALPGCLLLLAAVSPAQRLIAVDSTTRGVFEVDPATAARVQVGTMSGNVGIPAALAYDQFTGRMWVSSTQNDSLYVVDVTNWNATVVGSFGSSAFVMHGLEWVWSTNTLYGASYHDGGLYTIDTATGAATLVGLTGLPSTNRFLNLAYDVLTNTMFMTNAGTDRLYSVDLATAQVTMIGLMSTGWSGAAAFDYGTDTLFLTNNSASTLWTVSTTTGAGTLVGSLGSGNMIGLVHVAGAGRLTRASLGCGPTTIAVTGHPQIGSPITWEVGATTGFPWLGFGLNGLSLPFCGCTIAHDWAVALPGSSITFSLPGLPTVIGVQLFTQGLDLLGTGGCPSPQLTLTDAITLTIG